MAGGTIDRGSLPGRTCLLGIQRTKRLGGVPPKRPDQRPVILVRESPRPMILLELLQGGERAVAALGQLEASPCGLVGLSENVGAGRRRRIAEERERDEHDTGDGEQPRQHERERHVVEAGTPASS